MVYIAMTMSCISIIIAFLSILIQKKVIRSYDYINVKFDVTGSVITENIKYCRNKKQMLQQQISLLCKIDINSVEIRKPMKIRGGLKINMNLFVNNNEIESTETDIDYEKLIKDAKNNDALQNVIKSSWKLSTTPKINNIMCTKHESKVTKRKTKMMQAASKSDKSVRVDETKSLTMIEMNKSAPSDLNF